ncbi:MAG: DUF2806 domain-containing protein [Clostridia bacterium]|nr:DUF2806 domain-containing protein [Clostridia bacterium]
MSTNIIADIFNSIANVTDSISNAIINIREPYGLNKSICEGHKTIIEKVVSDPNISDYEKMVFISSYKNNIKKYKNVKNIIDECRPMLNNEADPKSIDEDWADLFFEKASCTSKEEIKCLWSKILASEINNPNTITKTLLHTISIIGVKEAEAFAVICKLVFEDIKDKSLYHPFVFFAGYNEYYKGIGLDESTLKSLDRLGLIEFCYPQEFAFKKKKVLVYGDKIIEVKNPNICCGNVKFTKDGQILYKIIAADNQIFDDSIFDFIIGRLKYRKNKIVINEKH